VQLDVFELVPANAGHGDLEFLAPLVTGGSRRGLVDHGQLVHAGELGGLAHELKQLASEPAGLADEQLERGRGEGRVRVDPSAPAPALDDATGG